MKIMKPIKSLAEMEIINLILDMEEKADRTKLDVGDAKELIKASSMCLQEIQTIRIKYERLKNSKKTN